MTKQCARLAERWPVVSSMIPPAVLHMFEACPKIAPCPSIQRHRLRSAEGCRPSEPNPKNLLELTLVGDHYRLHTVVLGRP